MPLANVDHLPAECDFNVADSHRVFRAVRGRTVREHSAVFRVFGHFKGSESLTGFFAPPKEEREPAPFAFHPWVSDDLGELFLTPLILVDGELIAVDQITKIDRIDWTPAHQRWFIRQQSIRHGFVAEWWLEIGSMDPVVEVKGRVFWSDRSDPRLWKKVEAVALRSGELYIDTFAKAKGMQEPIADGKDWIVPVSGPRTFGDGTGLDFSGEMLCFVSDPSTLPTDLDLDKDRRWISASIRSLSAARLGAPVLGLGKFWDGSYLAAKNTPRIDKNSVEFVRKGQLEEDWQRFIDRMETGGDFYDDRMFGCTRTPGQTGDQEDFGATKGTYAVTLGDPRGLLMIQQSAYADVYRMGSALYENDGSGKLAPLFLPSHPDWRTWSGYTHFHPGVSSDRLGKKWDGWPDLGPTGWHPYDDQHRSQNNLCALLALMDDPLAEAIVRSMAIPDMAMQEERIGAARAVGRLLGAWANFSFLLRDDETEFLAHERFVDRMDEKIRAVDLGPWINAPGPVKVVIAHGPDNRKEVYYPEGHPKAGEHGEWWSVWEHGLWAVGAYNALKADPLDDLPKGMLRSHLEDVLSTIIDEALIFDGVSKWFLCDDMLYLPNGQSIGEERDRAIDFADKEKKAAVVSPGIGGTTAWAFCAVLIATEVLTDERRLDRARQAVDFFTGGREAGDRRLAEWWACVRSVRP